MILKIAEAIFAWIGLGTVFLLITVTAAAWASRPPKK